MKSFDLIPIFGNIDIEEFGEDEYHSEIEIRNKPIEIELHFYEEKTQNSIQLVKRFLKQITRNEQKIKDSLNKNYTQKGEVKRYCEWLSKLVKESTIKIEENFKDGISIEKQIFDNLKLNRIGLYYPEDDLGFVAFDYFVKDKYGKNVVDHLICVKTDFKGKNIRINRES